MNSFYKDGRVHAYFKGILQSISNLKNRCMKLGIARRYPTAEYALENSIAHATKVCFISQYFTDERSSMLGDSCVPESGLGRQSFVSYFPKHQTISREIASKYQARSKGEANNKHRNGKEIAEDRQRKTRAEAEDCVEISRIEAKDFAEISRGEAMEVVYSDKLLTNFVPTSNILRVGFESASNFLRVKQDENSKPTRIKLDKKPKNGRIRSEERGNKVGSRTGVSEDRLLLNSGQLRTVFVRASENIHPAKYLLITFQLPFLGQPMVGRCAGGVQGMGEVRRRLEESTNPVPRMYCLGTVSSRGRYRKGTGSILRSYWRATKEVLRSYWKDTAISKFRVTSGREVGSSSLKGASSKLKSYLESALSQISSFKPFEYLSQVFTQVEYDDYSNRLKRSLSLTQGVGEGVGNKDVVRLFDAARFSIASILLLLLPFGAFASQAQSKQGYVLQGTVVSTVDKKPLQGVSVRVETENIKMSTKKDGSFSIPVSHRKGKVKFTNVGYKTVEQEYTSGVVLSVQLTASENQLEEIEVVSTGFQKIPKERATGSFEFVDNKLFNRKVSTDFVSRLEDVVPGMSSSKVYSDNRGKLININVRGLSTMQSERWPLVVIDGVSYVNNFDPLNGYFNNINPNDIENITILKDAAASSIWGAQSGNGVIVITTKRGKYNQPFQLSVNSNVTIGQKPDLYYYPQMNTSDYIELEKELFDKGYWNSRMNKYSQYLSPVIQLLKKRKEGNLEEVELNQQLDALRRVDMRDDFMKYIYRESVNQQYNVQLSGGSEKMNTSFSVGYDKNIANLVTSSYKRLSAKNNTQIWPLKNLVIDLGVTYTESKRKNAPMTKVGYNLMGRGKGNFPYMKIADENGNALAVDAIGFNPTFRDTVAGGRLLDWRYRPLQELYDAHILTHIRETMLNFKVDYQIIPTLNASVLYAYQRADQPTEDWQSMGTVSHRQTLNYYASWDKDKVTWNIPLGDYLNKQHQNNSNNQGRFQLDFDRNWNDLHELSAIAGTEVRQISSRVINSVYWGYDRDLLTHQPVQTGRKVPALNGIAGSVYLNDYGYMGSYINRYTSYFTNASYTYRGRYIVSGSARKDASNLFGVKTNNRGQPFWSIGGAWILSKESFINDDAFSLLKLRATYGYNGNVNNSTAAYPIINIQSSPDYDTGQPFANMQSPPNPSLRWERVGMLNLGLDFDFLDRISGSVEYYVKRPKDLISSSRVDPTTGYNYLNVNSADLDGRGVDLSLNSVNLNNRYFKWSSNLVFAYNKTRVLKSFLTSDRAVDFASFPQGMDITPIQGMDLYSLLTYKWAGLDPVDGMPRGFLDGEVSRNYSMLVNQSTIQDLENHGTVNPRFFGSFRNNFSYKKVEFSFNISYQLGHKFLRSSFSNRLFIDQGIGHYDYANRWKKLGDEQWTDVPAFLYPNNLNASELYSRSSALVERGDQIKVRDIQLSYLFSNMEHIGVKNLRLYAYVQNVGTLWRANKLGIDSEYGDNSPDPIAISIGLNLNL